MNLKINQIKSQETKEVTSVDIPVFEISDGKAQYSGRHRKAYGIASFHDNPRIIESVISVPRSSEELEARIKHIAQQVNRLKPGMCLCPTHPGWMKLLNDNLLRIELLFATSGEKINSLSSNYSRRNLLDFHLKEQSKHLGRLNVRVIRGNSPIAKHDGVVYIKAGTPESEPKCNPQKVIGYSDFSANQLKDQKPVLKGMMVVIEAEKWGQFCKRLHISDSVNAVVPEVTIKFYNEAEYIEFDFYSVFDTALTRKSALSVQACERVPLTEYGSKLVEATFRERIREIMDAYRDPSGLAVAQFINLEFKRLRESSDHEECDIDEFFLENAETLSATHSALISGLPLNDSEFLNATLPVLLQSRVKKISLPGLTVPVLPANIKPFEIIIPRAEAKRLDIKVGDRVTMSRFPNTGLEMSEVSIGGYTDLTAILINPEFWSQRFSGDFDGDLAGMLPMEGIVDESRIHNPTSPKEKCKSEMTISEAISRAFYAKLIIPQADQLVTVCVELGKDLSFIRSILQSCIDGIKHSIAFPNMSEIKKQLGIDQYVKPSPVSMLLRGRLGNTKKETALKYAGLIGQLSTVKSSVPWMKNLQSEFKLIVGPNRKYAEFALDKNNTIIKNYKIALIDFKQGDLVNLGINRETSPTLPKEITHRYLKGAINELNHIIAKHPEAVQLAHKSFAAYELWIKLLQNNQTETAYELLKDTRQELTEDKTGLAMRYLFIALVFQLDPGINIKSLKMLSYFPLIIGEYNLPKYLKALNYTRVFNVRIV